MAVNPITSDDLTIDLASLLSLSVSDRVQAAASDPGFAQALMQSLTPIQLAKAFPDYYRRELPDISNFILANRYLDSGGRFDQYGGGDYGEHKDMHSGDATLDNTARPTGVPQPTMEEMKAKLLEKGIDVQGAFDAIGNGLSADDPRVEFLKNMPAEKLTAMGIETYKDEKGNNMLRMKPIEEATMSDEEIIKQSTSKVGARPEGMNTKQSVMYGLQKRGFTKEEAAAVAGNVDAESSFRPGIVNSIGAVGYMQWLGPRKQGLFNYAQSVGKDWSDPEVQLDYIALERSGESVKYSGPNSSEKANYDKAFASGDPTQMAADFGRFVERPSAAELEGSMNTRIRGAQSAYETDATTYTPVLDENSTPQQIEEARKTLIENRKNARLAAGIREAYNQASPTSSDAVIDPTNDLYGNVIEMQRKVAGIRKGDIKTELKKSLSYAAEQSGDDEYQVDIVVTSGGQRMEGAEGDTGTHRHDDGGAADFNAYLVNRKTKERILLDPRKEEHVPYLTRLTTQFSRVHPSAGVGALYMNDPTKIHFGGDDVSEHGGRARGPLAYAGPDWFKEAHAAGIAQRAADIESKVDPLKEWSAKKEEQLKQKIADSKKTNTAELTPTQTTSQTSAAAPSEQTATTSVPTSTAPEIQSFQFGGTPTLQDDEDLTAVGPDGKPKFKFNSGEGLYVKPEANEYADDKINELSGRLDKMAESQNQPQRKMSETQEPKSDPKWAEKVASAYRPSGTQQRAFNRAQFRSEGRHVGDRGSPNIA